MIAETVDGIRASFPQAAELIERLWAEVRRLSDDEYVNGRPLNEHDRSGPFLGEPNVDVEFYDIHGNVCGSSTVKLELRVNDNGILIISETRVGFTAPYRLKVGGYRVFIGNDVLECEIAPVLLGKGDTYLLALNLPIKLGRGIGHNPGDDDGPPRPNPPTPSGEKTRSEV